jgi:hypothetical protein
MNTRFSRIDNQRFGPWALVTGASSGIGREFARQLAANGINLILAARRLSSLDEIGSDLTAQYGIRHRVVPVDLSEPDAVATLVGATGDLDVGLLVSNAGDMTLGEFLTHNDDEVLAELRLNTESHLRLVHHFGQRLVARARGGILLVSSLYGVQGVPLAANYSAAKSYLIAFGEAVHHELAPHGVNVTVLTPGITDTPMAARLGVDKTPMRRMLMPVDVCVREGLAALTANRATRIPGWMNRATIAATPRAARTRMFAAMNRLMTQRATNVA